MSVSKIKPAQMDMIIDRIYEGRCVPFLGAAANVSCDMRKYVGLPLGADVAEKLIKRIDFKGRDSKNLARVALQYEFDTDRSRLVQCVQRVLPDLERNPSPLLKVLTKLPLNLIITTNYDRLLERSLKEAGKDFKTIVQPIGGFEDKDVKNLEDLVIYKGCLIYKIHGTFSDNGKVPEPNQLCSEPSPIIVTEDDYIQFLTIIGKDGGRIGIPNLIKSKITPSTLLFLGYSLEDWDFRTIYKGLIETLQPHQTRKSFAIQKNPSEFWVEFWQKKGIEIYDIDLYDFAEQLEKRYIEKYGGQQGQGVDI